MSRHPHLMNRKGHYYFRITVPASLVCRFARKDLTYSLKTKYRTQAKIRCFAMLQVAHWLFRKVETMPRLTPEHVKEITQRYFKECLKRLECQLDTVDCFSSAIVGIGKSEPRAQAQVRAIDATFDKDRLDFLLPDNFKYDNPDDTDDVTGMMLGFHNHFNGDSDAVVQHLIEANNLEAENGTLSYQTLQKGAERAIKELIRLRDRKLDLEDDLDIHDDWFKDVPVTPLQPVSLSASSDTSNAPLISVAFKEFLAERKDEKANTLAQKQSSLDLWVKIHDDTPIINITAQQVREFKKTLTQLPKNKDKAKVYRDKSLADLLKMKIPDKDKMSVGTMNGYIGTLSTFMEWAKDQYSEYNLENHFANKRLKDSERKKEKREPFSKDQLKALFQTPIYKGCAGDNQVQRYKVGDTIIKDSLFWVPIIALYTGARMEEILRLRPADLYEVDNIWVFDINDDEQSLKTAKSKRKVPLHSDLVLLGVLDKKKEVEKARKSLLFCDTPKSTQGKYSKEYSKKFSRMLNKYKLKTEKTSFHSFRHNFKDAMIQASISKELRTALMGHEYGDVHDAVYGGQDIPIKKLSEAINAIEYSFLKISKGKLSVVS